ncbi:hypothetical protein GI584_14170 [Gracilibacillus salitolerans]|uniref:DUF2971 domain-containing protein n=1 Tax=Gracilibacillus salitolerans TaxID=2663022 RepID=A0A5Q2TJL1_9BACI|nr:DUF2971 domain-containing protein [Gracilibacillus salitolerans]QGH35119.1 hypothetical protein GI584_14170 [Gracilibacillus salitolerans]
MISEYSGNLRKFIIARDDFLSKYEYNNEYNINNIKDKSITNNTVIWKFMSFAKFISLLENEALYFSKPLYFRDPYEGAYSESDIYRILGSSAEIFDEEKQEYRLNQDQINELYKKNEIELDYVGVSCWHLNDEESAAMWDLYCSRDEGIAIRTTLGKLLASVDQDQGYDMKYGLVNYIDYADDMAGINTYETLFYKRKSFAHEQEFRLIVFESEEDLFFGRSGANVRFNLELLIDQIYIPPTAPVWFNNLVSSVVDRYHIKKEVLQSNLYRGPRVVK